MRHLLPQTHDLLPDLLIQGVRAMVWSAAAILEPTQPLQVKPSNPLVDCWTGHREQPGHLRDPVLLGATYHFQSKIELVGHNFIPDLHGNSLFDSQRVYPLW